MAVPPRQPVRTHLAQVCVEDGLVTHVSERRDELADAHVGQARVLLEQTMDLVLERVELGGQRRALVLRRLGRAQRFADRRAVQTGPPMQLLDRPAAGWPI